MIKESYNGEYRIVERTQYCLMQGGKSIGVFDYEENALVFLYRKKIEEIVCELGVMKHGLGHTTLGLDQFISRLTDARKQIGLLIDCIKNNPVNIFDVIGSSKARTEEQEL